MAGSSYARPQAVINVSKLRTRSEPMFRALLRRTPELEVALA
jgi:hypothetical protein